MNRWYNVAATLRLSSLIKQLPIKMNVSNRRIGNSMLKRTIRLHRFIREGRLICIDRTVQPILNCLENSLSPYDLKGSKYEKVKDV